MRPEIPLMTGRRVDFPDEDSQQASTGSEAKDEFARAAARTSQVFNVSCQSFRTHSFLLGSDRAAGQGRARGAQSAALRG